MCDTHTAAWVSTALINRCSSPVLQFQLLLLLCTDTVFWSLTLGKDETEHIWNNTFTIKWDFSISTTDSIQCLVTPFLPVWWRTARENELDEVGSCAHVVQKASRITALHKSCLLLRTSAQLGCLEVISSVKIILEWFNHLWFKLY